MTETQVVYIVWRAPRNLAPVLGVYADAWDAIEHARRLTPNGLERAVSDTDRRAGVIWEGRTMGEAG